ncbi:MAG: hypothetical protein JWR19_928 [Pedosphaera sp.]|jgi:hypothetical protein|nr:hypothetical protein [Pedosphaera sp.]
MGDNKPNSFEEANQAKQSSLVGEFIALLKQNKKYWLIPLLLVLLGLGTLIILGSTAAAPFIYTLF